MGVPDYYKNYLSAKIDRINGLTDSMTGNQDAFIFLTDYHGIKNTGNSPALIKEIIAKTGINMLVFGGDAYQTSTKPDKKAEYGRNMASVYNMFSELTDKFYPIIGNHEWNHAKKNEALEWQSEDTSYRRNGLLRLCLKYREDINEYGDYTIKNPHSKIIYVFLQIDGDQNMQIGQFAWLAGVLNGVPDGWGVIVFRHFVYTGGSSANTFDSRPRRNARMVSKMLMAYTERTKKAINNPTGNPEKINEKQTFDFTNAKGEVICLFGGHTHRDEALTKEKSSEGVLTIVTAGDLCWDGNDIMTYTDENSIIQDRTPGTVREQAFDVVQIDRKKRTIYCTRIGGGVDRKFVY